MRSLFLCLFLITSLKGGSQCLSGNCREGKGVFLFPDSSRYEGEFAAGKPEGWGSFSYPDGSRYIGNSREGLWHGRGTYYPAQQPEQTGEWWEGRLLGPWLDRGCLEGDCENGMGIRIFQINGQRIRYAGQFFHGFPQGRGEAWYWDGSHYSGEWRRGQWNGAGRRESPGDSTQEGYFQEGEYLGPELPQNTSTLPEWTLKRPSSLYAFYLGINEAAEGSALQYPGSDAGRVEACFRSWSDRQQVRYQENSLSPEGAEPGRILEAIAGMAGRCTPEDWLLIYLSGHGNLEGLLTQPDSVGRDLLPYRLVDSVLALSNAGQILVFVDACQVEAESPEGGSRSFSPGQGIWLMGASPRQESLESSNLESGIFTWFLVRGWNGEADLDRNGAISLDEIGRYLNFYVPLWTGGRQVPGIYGPSGPLGVVSGP